MSIEQLNSPIIILFVRNLLYFHSDILADKNEISAKSLIINYYERVQQQKTLN